MISLVAAAWSSSVTRKYSVAAAGCGNCEPYPVITVRDVAAAVMGVAKSDTALFVKS
jgi:hypothetical protein